jgi:hypothetical protein
VLSAPGESEATKAVVATRKKTGGFIGLISSLTVHADGTLNILDNEFSRDETKKVPQERVRPLVEALSRPEWQEISTYYGEPQGARFSMVIEGGGKHTQIEVSSEAGSYSPIVSVPPTLEEVLTHLENLWRTGT